jgi:hypothetical protein
VFINFVEAFVMSCLNLCAALATASFAAVLLTACEGPVIIHSYSGPPPDNNTTFNGSSFRCESLNGEFRECVAPRKIEGGSFLHYELVTDLSNGRCIPNSGYNKRRESDGTVIIWVNKGCRGIFALK